MAPGDNSHPFATGCDVTKGRPLITTIAVAALMVCAGSNAFALSSVEPEPSEMRRWIVRPASVVDLTAAGLDPATAQSRRRAAEARLLPMAVSSVGAIDATVIRAGDNDVRSLMETGDYLWAEPDAVVRPLATPNDPLFGSQWHLARIGAPSAWDRSTGSRSVIVAMVDTGVDPTHPDLAGSLLPGYNSESRLAQSAGGEVHDLNGHGTATAGVLGALGNNAVGVAGVTWSVAIMPVRASNMASGSAFFSDILDGIGWAGVNGADIVSVSYEGVNSRSAQDMGAYLRSLDALLVWGSGNSGGRLDNDWPDVIVVGGSDRDDRRWTSSPIGSAIDLLAPSVDVLTASRGGGYGARAGTSFSTPIVSGVAALLRAADPRLTSRQIETLLIQTAQDLGAPGRDPEHGWGRVDAGRALAAVSTGGGTGPRQVEPDLAAGTRFRMPGLLTSYYRTGPLTALPDLGVLRPDATVVEPRLDFPTTFGVFGGSGMSDGFAARFRGVVSVPAAGDHTFWLISDDGSRLSLGGVPLIDNDGVHGAREVSSVVRLRQGLYTLQVDYFDAGGAATLRVDVQAPGGARTTLPASWITFRASPADCNGDAVIDFTDLLVFLTWYNARDPRADMNGDGAIDQNDWLDFLNAYLAGG